MVEHAGVRELDEWGLVVMDMQNDFLAAGGYYARRSDLAKQVGQGKLTVEASNRLLSQPSVSPTGELRYRATSLSRIATNVCTVIKHARAKQRPIAYLKAVYSRDFDVQPPFLTQESDREHYPCKPNSWGATFIEPISQLVDAKQGDSSEKVIEKTHLRWIFPHGPVAILAKVEGTDRCHRRSRDTCLCVGNCEKCFDSSIQNSYP